MKAYRSKGKLAQVVTSTLFRRRQEEAEAVIEAAISRLHVRLKVCSICSSTPNPDNGRSQSLCSIDIYMLRCSCPKATDIDWLEAPEMLARRYARASAVGLYIVGSDCSYVIAGYVPIRPTAGAVR